jgi:hypothetical protein
MIADLVRLVFPLEPDQWHGNATERIWAEPLGRDRFRLRNTPFYAFGVSSDDIVLGAESEGQVQFMSVVLHGGHSTYRLRCKDRTLNAQFVQAWAPLQKLGCSYEEGLVLAVDVPPRADICAVYDLLQAGEAAGVWDFEEGHCGHPLAERG